MIKILQYCGLLLLLISLVHARQIRISRYNKEVSEDNEIEIQAKVKEIERKAPYAAAGYRPSRAFPLPGDDTTESQLSNSTESNLDISTTTEYATDMTSTTLEYESTESSTLYNDVPAELEAQPQARQLEEKAPYAPAGYRPSKAFNLPTEVAEDTQTKQAPYPAAGYRPRIAFVLPTEVNQSLEPASLIANSNTNDTDVSTHPACGVSTNPLHPVPAPDAKQDPDAETVVVEAPIGSTLIRAEVPVSLLQYQAQPLVSAPLILGPRAVIYAEQLHNL